MSISSFFLASVLAAGMLGQASVPSADPSAAPSATPAPAASPAIVVVHIKDFAYVPKAVKIKAGQTVRFINDDDMPHTVTADDKKFDSGDMQKGAAWSRAFTKEGTAEYFCVYHPFMRGSVEVSAP